jgi:hypothetical protein
VQAKISSNQERAHMAKLPTPQDAAQFLISHMVSVWNGRPDNVFNFRMINVFRMENYKRFTGDEFTKGLEYAVEQGWLEPTSNQQYPSFKLTTAGFDAA